MPILARNRHRYPDDWRELRQQIRERSGGRCECRGECGRLHVDGSRGWGRCWSIDKWEGVVLTVAHLDHQPETREIDMLRHFCQGCHNRYDADHRAQTRRETKRLALAAMGQLVMFLVDAAQVRVHRRRQFL
jgi:hypothetical protein